MITGTQIPYITPIITFFLGLIAVPIIEWVKNYLEKKRLLRSLKIELLDEILHIDREFELLFQSYKSISSINISKDENEKLRVVIPDRLRIFSIEKLLNFHFENIEVRIRRSIKNVNETTEHLNSISINLRDYYRDILPDILQENNQVSKLIYAQSSYLCGILNYRYNIKFLINTLNNESTNLKIFSDIEHLEAVKIQLIEIGKVDQIEFLIKS